MKARQIRDIGDESWDSIVTEAKRREMKVGVYLVAAHRLLKAQPAATGVRPVTPQVRERTMYACKMKGCNFHTAINRPCPRHPHSGLRKVA